MENKRYKLSSLAQQHLVKIKRYTLKNHSQTQWQRYKTSLLASLQTLANNPKLGKSCNDIYPGGRYFPIEKHVAYFVHEKDIIIIVAILSQSQSPQRHL